ncbi:MAG: ABC transporter substrate-binding protein [Micromonosporaceae bacterium]|nr:ABC transporter substrate-binding protein [Micromonosporaceae bacterium]
MLVRRSALVAAFAAGLLLASGCAANNTSSGTATVRIGLIWPQSGVYKAIGDDFAHGWQLYLDSHGNKLGGHPVTTNLVDEGDGRQAARDGIAKLTDQFHAEAVVGTISSDAVEAVNPVVTAKHIPYVGTGGRPDDLKNLDYTWDTSWQNADAGVAIADYIRTSVHGSVYAIGPNYVGGYDQVNGFVDTFTKGGGKLANPGGKPTWTPYPNITNFVPYLNQIATSGAKAVFAFYAGALGIAFVKQYAQVLGGKIPLYAAGFTTEGAVLGAQGAAADGVYSSLNYAPDLDNPANQAFATAFQQKYNATPDLYNVTAWDAALVLDRAIAAAGANPSAESINAAISKLGALDSPRGQWRFGTQHTPIQPWYLRVVRTDGRGRSNVVVQTLTTLGS